MSLFVPEDHQTIASRVIVVVDTLFEILDRSKGIRLLAAELSPANSCGPLHSLSISR